MDTNAMQYSVEDDLDVEFFKALKQMQESSHHHIQNHTQDQAHHADDTACLITDEPLNAFHVQLECGHKFNYEPLLHFCAFSKTCRESKETLLHVGKLFCLMNLK